ncbi:MAG: hypothetical protein ACFFD1_04380, partial [Candidatus Thorarchaeota archaeon]
MKNTIFGYEKENINIQRIQIKDGLWIDAGCGSGAYTIPLSFYANSVIAIDKDRNEVDLIRDQVSLSVRLDSTDEEALIAQGVNKVDFRPTLALWAQLQAINNKIPA